MRTIAASSRAMSEDFPFAPRGDHRALEEGDELAPAFGANGLLSAVVTDAESGEVLMLAHMNAEALRLTLVTGLAHYRSRARRRLWKKGEQSGHVQELVEARIDCDQDAVWLRVRQHGPGACHVGYRSCFYRRIEREGAARGRLSFVMDRSFDPNATYGAGEGGE